MCDNIDFSAHFLALNMDMDRVGRSVVTLVKGRRSSGLVEGEEDMLSMTHALLWSNYLEVQQLFATVCLFHCSHMLSCLHFPRRN